LGTTRSKAVKPTLSLLLFCSAAVVLAAEPSTLRFQHVIIDQHPPRNPWIKIVGDLNRDGKLDIIIGGSKGPLVWYRNPDWQKFVIADGGYNTVAGVAVDIDGDEDLDIALGGVVWFENPGPAGEAATGPWAAHQVEQRRGHDLLAADLNGNGRVDLIMRDQSSFGSKTGHTVFLYQQITPDQWSRHELHCGEGEGVYVADVNDDQRPDIVIGGSWFESGDNPFQDPWSKHVFTTQWNYPHTKVAVADLNSDDRPDIILAPAELKGGTHRIAWYEAPADAKASDWRQHIIEAPVETVIHALAAADFDRDGKTDVAAARMHQGSSPRDVAVYLNSDEGLSWRRQVLATTGSHDIVAADLDGNGWPDILGANHGGPFQPVELWRNLGTVRSHRSAR
jgi:hypothetical protein